MAAPTSFAEFVDEGVKIVNDAEEQKIVLRLMGALAVSYHCPKYRHLHEKMDRVPTDIDFASISKQKEKLTGFLELRLQCRSANDEFPKLRRGKEIHVLRQGAC